MRRIICCVALLMSFFTYGRAADLNSMSWTQICTGGMGEQWYGSDEARIMADLAMDVQKNSGGWAKNCELHRMSSAELAALKASREDYSCLDNAATTQEMRFLARVWKKTGEERYRKSFVRALDMIFEAEKGCGGWSQYWPLRNNKGYHDYITFNDDLVTNVIRLLKDINDGQGDFGGIVDDATKERCEASFDRSIDMIIKCQIDDNGVKAAWCAQHDSIDFLPTEGRPHELPSVSGAESANLLSFLMTVPQPSAELQTTIRSAVDWLEKHKIENKAIEPYVNAAGEEDYRIVDKPGSDIWGRFIQIGGESGRIIYEKLFDKLKKRGRRRSYVYNGKTYVYTEEEIARANYREDKAYQPIFSIYSDEYPHLFYRFLYNYEDTPPVNDEYGVPVATSLASSHRRNYHYLGSWCRRVIDEEYPLWERRLEYDSDKDICVLSDETYSGSLDEQHNYGFSNGFSVSNASGKRYSAGKSGTVKYSANVEYCITIPDGLKIDRIELFGYDNYDTDAYLSHMNGINYAPSEYVFPAKINGNPRYVSHIIDFSGNPIEGAVRFSLGSKQCCLIIALHCLASSGLADVTDDRVAAPSKYIKDGKLFIMKDERIYNISGQIAAQD